MVVALPPGDAQVAAGQRDLTIVNTCAVTAEAARDGRRAVRAAIRARPGARIVATGCAVQTEPARFAAMPEIATLVGNARKTALSTWIDLAADRTVPDIMAETGTAQAVAAPEAGRTRALLQVQNGCDHRCTFCIIPYGRGPSRSVPLADAVAAARGLVEGGAREIVLTGVDLTDWRDGERRLGDLARAILRAVPELPRLRLSSIDPVEADPALLDALACEDRLMPHLHVSLQAGDDLVLKRMKRRHSRADAVRFCETVRRLRPDIVFGADLIAGFPTEDDAMAARSLDLVAECDLVHLHVFPYSARPGTPAARMPAVPAATAKERAARLREAGAAALARHLDGLVGSRVAVLAEAGGTGRTEGFAAVRFGTPVPPGSLVEATITGHDGRRARAA